jgi:two-component system cell cycle sensor histidine kinase/response regulator CckA
VESEEGKGTIFTIYFPASREELTNKKQDDSIKNILGKGEIILVVDDVEEQRIIASQVLTKIGYKVKTVASGEQAIKYVKTNSPALIILDMIMEPGLDGLETYKKILELRPRQKALLVSGFSETERVKTAQELGAGMYIRKPYTLQKIGKAIKSELNREENLT